MSPRRLSVTTGSRLHFGLWSLTPEDGRRWFGGLGMMIDAPQVRLDVSPTDTEEVIACDEETVRRTRRVLERLSVSTKTSRPMRIEVHETIPPHAGFGSGTQLELAVAAAWNRWNGGPASAVELAARIGRGRRSAIGIHGFDHGGFLVDGGHAPRANRERVAPLLARNAVPDGWKILLARPSRTAGLSGQQEESAFDALADIPPTLTDRLCGITLTRLLPALAEADFDAFSEAIYEYGMQAGEAFSSVQGGPFATGETAELIKHLRGLGIRGAGQSSWGPGVFGFCEDESQAFEAQHSLRQRFDRVEVQICSPKNSGAEITFDEDRRDSMG